MVLMFFFLKRLPWFGTNDEYSWKFDNFTDIFTTIRIINGWVLQFV